MHRHTIISQAHKRTFIGGAISKINTETVTVRVNENHSDVHLKNRMYTLNTRKKER